MFLHKLKKRVHLKCHKAILDPSNVKPRSYCPIRTLRFKDRLCVYEIWQACAEDIICDTSAVIGAKSEQITAYDKITR